jgi:PTEN phosphatase family protein
MNVSEAGSAGACWRMLAHAGACWRMLALCNRTGRGAVSGPGSNLCHAARICLALLRVFVLLALQGLRNPASAPSTAFRGVVLCGFPDMPGHLQEHLVVVDVKDRAIFVGNPQQDEWQVFPERVFVPLARVMQVGNTVRVQGNDRAGPSVDVHFNFKADASAFLAAVSMAMQNDGGDESSDGGVQQQERNPVVAGARVPSQTVVSGRSEWQMHEYPAPDAAALPAQPAHHATPPVLAAELGFAGSAAPANEGKLQAAADGEDAVKAALIRALDKKLDSEIDRQETAAYHLSTQTVAHAIKQMNLSFIDDYTLLSVVIGEFEQHDHLLYLDERGTGSVISKKDFVPRLVITSTSKKTFGDWLHDALTDHGLEIFPQIPSIDVDEKLVDAMELMLDSGAHEFCVRDEKHHILGIITYDAIIESALKDFVAERVLKERTSAGSNTTTLPMRFATVFDPFEGWGALRTGAASWVTSGVTETAVIFLTVIDILASIVDSFVFNPCITCEEEWATLKEYRGTMYSFNSEKECIAELFLYDCNAAATLQHPLNAFTGVILIIFVTESLTRLYAFRLSIFKDVLDIMDFVIVYASVATFIWMIAAAGSKVVRQIVTVGRVMRFLRLIRMLNKLRRTFMAENLRYRKNGFNLDLTYVTNNVIAMPLPGQGLEAKQYNNIADIARFFQKCHVTSAGPSFLIFNVCAERTYPTRLFSNQVMHLPVDKNSPPLLESLCKFVKLANEWMETSSSNVIAVHDISGLTRTGTFIVCWLLYSGFATKSHTKSAVEDAIEWYSLKRVGVPKESSLEYMPSKLRYFDYFNQTIEKRGYSAPGLCLDKIILWTVPAMRKGTGGCCPWFTIMQDGDKEIYDYSKYNQINQVLQGREKIVFDCGGRQLRGDIKITFYDQRFDENINEEMFFICFHTGFVSTSNWVVPLKEIDGAHKDEGHQVYSPEFRVEFIFAEKKSKGLWRELQPASEMVLDEAQESSARLRADMAFSKSRNFMFRSMLLPCLSLHVPHRVFEANRQN